MVKSQVRPAPFTFGQVYYLTDADAHLEANRRGENYWHAYLPEILDHLGVRGQAIERDGLADLLSLDGLRKVLILRAGDLPGGSG